METLAAKSEFIAPDDKRIEDTTDGEKKLSSDGELEAFVEVSDEEGRKILSKVDYRLVPILALLYLVAFLDRSNSKLLSCSSLPGCVSPVLTSCSWKCECSRLVNRSGPPRPAVQHRRNPLLCSLHDSRSPQQHCFEDDETIALDHHSHVLLGSYYDVNGSREQLQWASGWTFLLGRH